MSLQLSLWLPGVCSPKTRPRATVIKNAGSTKKSKPHVYNCPRYRAWKNWATCSLYKQAINQFGIETNQLPLEHIELLVVFVGSHRGDGENLMGAVMDAAVEAKIIAEDYLKNIPRGCWERRLASDTKLTGTLVVIKEVEPKVQLLESSWEKWILAQKEVAPTLPKTGRCHKATATRSQTSVIV